MLHIFSEEEEDNLRHYIAISHRRHKRQVFPTCFWERSERTLLGIYFFMMIKRMLQTGLLNVKLPKFSFPCKLHRVFSFDMHRIKHFSIRLLISMANISLNWHRNAKTWHRNVLFFQTQFNNFKHGLNVIHQKSLKA